MLERRSFSHRRWAIISVTMALLAGPGCGWAEPQPPPQQLPAEAAPWPLAGTWRIVLSPEDQHQRKVLELALQTPRADSSQLEKSDLSSEERMTIEMIAMAKAQDPDDPKVLQMQAMLDAMGQTTLIVTDEQLTLIVGEKRTEWSHSTTGQDESSMELHLTTAAGSQTDATLSLIGEGVLRFHEQSQPTALRFIRKR